MQLFVSVAIFPLEAFTSHIKHCQYPTVVRCGYILMDNNIIAIASLVAYDSLVYISISSTADSLALQEDLDIPHKWSNEWQVKFNIDKCHTMRITLRRNTINTGYHLGGSTLFRGVTIPISRRDHVQRHVVAKSHKWHHSSRQQNAGPNHTKS